MKPVRPATAAAVLSVGCGVLLACATGPGAETAQRARTALVGMPKERLLSCAGVPERQAAVNGKEYYTYVQRGSGAISPSTSVGIGAAGGGGGGGVGLGLGFGFPVGGGSQGCEATFVLGGGVVEQVSYPASASLSACAPIVQNCLPPAPR